MKAKFVQKNGWVKSFGPEEECRNFGRVQNIAS
jgi:hypothetical protein